MGKHEDPGKKPGDEEVKPIPPHPDSYPEPGGGHAKPKDDKR